MAASELSLDRDPSSRFVPWIVAALSLMCAIALGTAFALASMTEGWSRSAADQVTLRVATGSTDVPALVDQVSRLSAVSRIERLPRDRVAAMLQPWLGDLAASDNDLLPLPELIDVRLNPGADLQPLSAIIADLPEVTLDSADAWLAPLQDLTSLARMVAWALAAVAVGAIMLVTVFATRSALVNQRPTVDLLRLIGAADGYIARRFQRHGLRLALVGGIAGTVPGLIVIFFATAAARLQGATLLNGLSPSLAGWIAIAALPLIVAVVATFTARITVLKLLRASW
ncbi:MAG: hypothetical protein P1U65_11540 [Minwuia sp.]|nr:hypothetical protein [Minwuia sp.]